MDHDNKPAAAVGIKKPAEFFETSAKCIKRCADDMAGGLAAIPEEDKPTTRRAILRNLRNWLELSRWHNLFNDSKAGGRAGV